MKEVATWMGRPISDLTREELVQAITWLANEMQKLRDEQAAVYPFVDWPRYLRDKALRP